MLNDIKDKQLYNFEDKQIESKCSGVKNNLEKRLGEYFTGSTIFFVKKKRWTTSS